MAPAKLNVDDRMSDGRVHCSLFIHVDCRLWNTSRAVNILIFFIRMQCLVVISAFCFCFFLSLSFVGVKQLCVVISNQISEYFGNNFNISEDKAAESLSIISKVKRKGIGINSYLCYSSCAKAAIHLHDPVLFARKKVSFFHLLFLSFSHSLFVCFFIAFAIFGSKDIT